MSGKSELEKTSASADLRGIPTYGCRIPLGEESAFGRGLRAVLTWWPVSIVVGLLALAALAVFGSGVFRAANDSFGYARSQTQFREGYDLAEAGRFAEAIPLLTSALQGRLSARDRAYAFGERGWAYMSLGRDAEALRDFDEALKIDPKLLFALFDRGLVYHRQGRFEEALADYNQTLRLDPNKAAAYRNRAFILAQRGRLKDAISDMSESIRCAPHDPRAYVGRARLLALIGDLDGALASFESAIGIDPENVGGHWGRAGVLRQRSEGERAIREMDELVRLHPDSALLVFARGLIHDDDDHPNEATADFETALRLKPDFAMAYSNRGSIELRYGTALAALALADMALQIDPKLAPPHHVRGLAFDARGEYAAAIAEFDQALALERDNVWTVVMRALTESHAGNHEIARQDLNDALETFPGPYATHAVLALFLASCPDANFRDSARALREAHEAVRLARGNAHSLDVLAIAYANAGDFARATQLETLAMAKTPRRAPVRRAKEARRQLFRNRTPYREER